MRTILVLAAASVATAMTASCASSSGGSSSGGSITVATPTFTPAGGTYTSAQSVIISDTTPGAVIHYTTDGSTPTASSATYASAVQVATNETLKAMATAPGDQDSPIGSATYVISILATDFATTCAAVQADYLALGVSCLKANPNALASTLVHCDSLATEIQAGRIIYDATHASDCLAAVAGLGCADLVGGGEPAACRLALVGQAATGSICYDGADCPAGTCSAVAGACPGLCVAYAAIGGACPHGNECAAGLACDGSTGTCKTASGAGGACPCQAGLYCNGSGTCAAQQTSGACAMNSPAQCAIGYRCLGSPTPTCQPLVGLGSACSVSGGASACGLGYDCVSGTCVASPMVGQACTSGQTCIGGTCNGTVCVGSSTSATCGAAPGATGLSLYDAFGGPSIDGKRWQNGGMARGVSAGSAVFSIDVTDEEARSIRNGTYVSQAGVVTGGARVTTLQANITVPIATATRTGGSQIRAYARIHYSPPSSRLNFPGALQDLLVAEVGLVDDGSGGLKAYRQFSHCDDASCATRTTSGLAVTDPTSFTTLDGGLALGAAAAYDTTYTATVSFEETTSVFHWTISGGSFGAGGVSGTADPSAYLTATPSWASVPLAGTGFQVAQIGVRSNDLMTGGGSARITGRFANVKVGFNNAAASAFDDFSGAGGNSGPTELSPARWQGGGATSLALSGGSLVAHEQITDPGATLVGNSQALAISDPTGVNALQADVAMEAFNSGGAGGGGAEAGLSGRFYNDGSGTRDNDAIGDIRANLFIRGAGAIAYDISRCANTGCGTTTLVGSGTLPGPPAGIGGHRLLLRWDPTTKHFTFGVDGTTTEVDPTTAGGGVTTPAAYGAPARSPVRSLYSNAGVAAGFQGGSASGSARFSDVFTGP